MVGQAAAQQKQRVIFKAQQENSKYTQRNAIDVGDVLGHQVRVYEIYRTYPNNAPTINGLKLKETWTRGLSDYIDGNGPNVGYSVFTVENGDKFFIRTSTVAQNPGSGKLTTASAGTITGGMGKLAGEHQALRSRKPARPSSNTKSNTGWKNSIRPTAAAASPAVYTGPDAADRRDCRLDLPAASHKRRTSCFQIGCLITWEFPRLCRGGSRSLTYPGV